MTESKVIYQDIDSDFGKYLYQDFSIIFMKKNGYINATKLCGGVKNKRPYKEWVKIKSAKNMLKSLSDEINIPIKDLTITIRSAKKTSNVNNSYELRGTYVHRYLVNSIQ